MNHAAPSFCPAFTAWTNYETHDDYDTYDAKCTGYGCQTHAPLIVKIETLVRFYHFCSWDSLMSPSSCVLQFLFVAIHKSTLKHDSVYNRAQTWATSLWKVPEPGAQENLVIGTNFCLCNVLNYSIKNSWLV
jgi:hypothetical protein